MIPTGEEASLHCFHEETLELYVLRRLPAEIEEQLDLHLLGCEDCQQRCAAEERNIELMQEALAQFLVEEKRKLAAQAPKANRLFLLPKVTPGT